MMSDCEWRTFLFGKKSIDYCLLYRERKTMEIAVLPDRRVVIKVPNGTDLEIIEYRIKKRATWIIKQRNYFNQFLPLSPPRFYVSGESHLYLGRRYRLKVFFGKMNSVKLKAGCIEISCSKSNNSNAVRSILEKWYREKASFYFSQIFERCWQRFSAANESKPNLIIKKMLRRWGSLSSMGNLSLNLNLIHASKECIEYVIMHELCHIRHHDHNEAFYKLLGNSLPNWQRVKNKLELLLS